MTSSSGDQSADHAAPIAPKVDNSFATRSKMEWTGPAPGSKPAQPMPSKNNVEIDMASLTHKHDTPMIESQQQQQPTRSQSGRNIPTRTLSGRVLNRTPSKLESFVDPNSPMTIRVHRCPLSSLVTQLNTDTTTGLPQEYRTVGLNKVTQPPQSIVRKILGYVFGGFNAIMWIAMILAILSYKPLGGDNPQIVSIGVAIVLFLVICFSSLFYARVDFAANKMMDAMRGMVANDCLVIRDGQEMVLDANDVSVGDILVLSLGQRVAADIRLIECSSDLAFDRSLLTGESDPINGTTQCTDRNFLETKNIALSSSFVLRGSAKGIVYAIGDDTVIGQIVKLASKPKQAPTPIQREITRFTIVVSIVAFSSFILAIVLWAVWQRTSYPGFNTAGSAIVNAIGCLCALVPQGLPVAFALSLSIIASKMADAQVLVKNLSTIETLGCMSLICSDKTGTLTTGKMTVQKCITLEHDLDFAASAVANMNKDNNSNDIKSAQSKVSLALPDNTVVIAASENGGEVTLQIAPELLKGLDPQQPATRSSAYFPSTNSSVNNNTRNRLGSSFHTGSLEESTTSTRLSATAILSRASSHHQSAGPRQGLQESIKLALRNTEGGPAPSTFAVHRIASLCCGAVFLPQFGAEELPIEERAVNGDPTDTAVLRFTHAAKPHLGITDEHGDYLQHYTTLFTLPFNSNNKFMATVVIEKSNPNAKPIIFFKGAPDIILTKCNQVFMNNGDGNLTTLRNKTDDEAYKHHLPTDIIQQRTATMAMDDQVLDKLTVMKNDAAKQGLRVIALAQVEIDDLMQIPELQSIPEGPDDLEENNLDDLDCDDYENKDDQIAIPMGITVTPSKQVSFAPCTSDKDDHKNDGDKKQERPTIAQPRARYLYPQDWEGFVLQTISKKQSTFAGCLAIMDPPRPDVPDTINTMATAGVAVAMVTGDFQLTAESIARRVNIITCPESNVYHAKDLAKLQLNWETVHKYPTNLIDMKPSPEPNPQNRRALVLNGSEVGTLAEADWHFICCFFHEFVFARTTPEHKQTIVEAFKTRGRVVAVTGDGVNDCAALKSADIGVAMGAGADLAKDTASIILLQNSFSSLLVGLIYGRLVFQNLRKIIMYLMSTGAFVEFLAVVVNVLLGTPLPLSSFLQVTFCATNDIAMSISLMFEQPEGDILDAPPRDVRKDRLVDWRWLVHAVFQYCLVTFICSIGMWFMTLHDYNIGFNDVIIAFNKWSDGFKGHSKAELILIANRASAAYYACMVFCNFGNLLAIRSRRTSIIRSSPLSGQNKNLYVPLCMFISLCIAFFVLYLPGLPGTVGTARINWKYWIIPIAFPFGIILIDEGRKYLVRHTKWMAKIAW